MALALQVLVTGLAAGAVYGLVAVGYSLIYRLTGVVHFALGELVGLAVFVTLFVAAGTGPVTQTNVSSLRYALSLVVGLVAVGLIGGLVYLIVVRPFLMRGSTIGWIGGTVAVAFAVDGFLNAVFERPSYVFPDPFPFEKLPGHGVIQLGGGASIQVRTFFVLALGIGLALAASAFLQRTRTGAGLRAIEADAEAARLVGVPFDRLLTIAFVLSGVLAALAAIVAAPEAPVSVQTGALLGLKGLVAALIGRFRLPWPAFGAGLGLGVIETSIGSFHFAGITLGPAYQDVLPLALAFVALAVLQLGSEGRRTE